MDKPDWKLLSQLTPQQLHTLLGGLADELLARARAVNELATKSRDLKATLLRATASVSSARGHFREFLYLLETSAAPSSAATPAVNSTPPRDGAAEVPLDTRPCKNCRGLMGAHAIGCRGAVPQCPRCKTEGVDHEGECRPLPPEEGATSSALTAEPSGQRGPKAAEGTGEAGRAEKGRGERDTTRDLAFHLAMVKNGGVA